MAKIYFHKEDAGPPAPRGPCPVHATTLADLAKPPASGLRLTWMGHSSVLAEIDGRRVLFDPVWGERCSPFPFAGPKRLHPVPLPLAALGPVDVVVISHDHYDHLDLPTIKALASTDTVFAVPLGVGAHLERWGVSADRLRELDWNESTKVGGLTADRHPGPALLRPRPAQPQHTLWASWVVAGPRAPDLPQRRHRVLPRLQGDRRRARPVRRHHDPDRRVQRVLARHPHDPRRGHARPPRPAGRQAARA